MEIIRTDASTDRMRPGEFQWRYTGAELKADAFVHILGLALAVAGTVLFWTMRPPGIGRGQLTASGVYLATLFLSLAASASYNIWPVRPFKWILRRLDHSAIYLLIAGTYTPFMVKLGSWWMLAAVWLVAGVGVGLKLFWPGRLDRLSIALYLALGWNGIAIFGTLVETLPAPVLWLIVSGGLVYSFGVVFHLWEGLRFQNVIWHGFVLAAATIHFVAVCLTMNPAA